MKTVLLNAVLALAIVGCSLAAYDRIVIRPLRWVGVVDVGEVYRQKEAEFTLILTQSGSDAERKKAFSLARTFSQRLPIALEELPRECDCLVVHKSALAGPTTRTVDLTAQLRRKVETP